jgi:hypothetical protein
MHYAFVAVESTVDRLMAEFPVVWPDWEISRTETVPSIAGFLDWQKANERRVAARDWRPDNPGVEVYGFLQSGRWAVLLDSSYVLASDAEALAKLSTTSGTCVAFVNETTGGCASFVCFKHGESARRVDSVDGNVELAGEPIPEEAGLDMDRYYMEEAEALEDRLGLSFLRDPAPAQILAVAAADRADYAHLLQQQPAQHQPPAGQKKPWWKLW